VVSGFDRAPAAPAAVIDLAAFRAKRCLPPPRPTAREAEPPAGKRPGDRVRHIESGEIGTVLSFRAERAVDDEGRPFPVFMLGVHFPAMRRVVYAHEVEALSGPTAKTDREITLPADAEA
jgi:hypothetical protein